jgi:Helix-turn-helix domain
MAEFLQDNLRVFVVPVEIMDVPGLDVYEQMVYFVLRSFASAREATAFPSYTTIAKLGRMSRRKAIDCVAKLVEKGLLKKEVRLDITNNRKIRNTSNLYTIESPKMVHAVHQGSARCAPRVVHAVHQGGAQRAPEHNYLTKPNRTIVFNNNKEDTNASSPNPNLTQKINNDVVDLLTQKGIKINQTTLTKWKKLANEETILSAIHEVVTRPDINNIVGYITRMLEQGYCSSQISKIKRKNMMTLPHWIEKQETKKIDAITDEQKQQALELLKKLEEI